MLKSFTKSSNLGEPARKIVINLAHVLAFEESRSDQIGKTILSLADPRDGRGSGVGSYLIAVEESVAEVRAAMPGTTYEVRAFDQRVGSVFDGRTLFLVAKQIRAMLPHSDQVFVEFADGSSQRIKNDVFAAMVLDSID